METRFQALEVRAVQNGNKRTIRGYAARYGVLSGPIPAGNGTTFRERIAPGAFRKVLADKNLDCVCLFNHSMDAVLGRTTAGTLRLSEDARGLAFECDLLDTQIGRDTFTSVQRQDLSGMSFAFTCDDRMCDYRHEEIDDEEEDDDFRSRAVRKVKALVRTL